jgi:PAS domain S-box-containing protein
MEDKRHLERAFQDLAAMVELIGELSAHLHGLADQDEILRAVTDHFSRSREYTASVLLLTEDGSGLRVARSSLSRRETRAGEKASGVRLEAFVIDLQKCSLYRRVVKGGETVTTTVSQIVKQLFPSPIANLIAGLLGYEGKHAVLTPLTRDGEVVGALATSAPALPEYLVPSVKNLAHHLSTALELAEQHKERETAAEQLRASEARYKALFEQAAESILVADSRDGAILDFNDRAHESLGCTREELSALTVYDFQDPGAADKLLAEAVDALETKYRTKGGQLMDVLVSSRPISVAGRDVVQIAWRDITGRKQAREALRRSEERYRSLVSNIPDVVWTTDRSGATTFISSNAEQVTGYTPQEIYEGGASVWLGKVHPDDAESVKRAFAALFDVGAPYDVQYRYMRKDGVWIWLHDRAVSLHEKEGTRYADGLLSDVTELREMQEKALLQEKLAVMGQLAAGVGHELRNPLGAIKNAAYFLRMALEADDPDTKEAIDILSREVETSERIVSSLLGFARPQAPAKRGVNINEVLEMSLSRTDVPENVQVIRRLGRSLPPIQADPGQLDRLFGNVILNAIQAMPQGGRLTIRSSGKAAKTGEQQHISVSISDSGVGIPQENQDKLFEPLFTTKAKGIGLGLPLAAALAEVHGGSIAVESEVGRGSTFTVTLPVPGAAPPGAERGSN